MVRGAPARRGSTTGHEGLCRGHWRAARVAARPMRATAARERAGKGAVYAARRFGGGGSLRREVVHKVERERDGEKGTDGILTSLRSSGSGSWRQGGSDRWDRRRREPWPRGYGGGTAWLGFRVAARVQGRGAGRLHPLFCRLGQHGKPRNACGADSGAGGCGRVRNSRGLGMTGGSHSWGPAVSGSRWEKAARGERPLRLTRKPGRSVAQAAGARGCAAGPRPKSMEVRRERSRPGLGRQLLLGRNENEGEGAFLFIFKFI